MICQCLVHQDLSARQRQITIFCQPRPIIVNYFSHNIPIFLSPTNWSLPSSKNPHFQNETMCTTFHVKMRFICMRMKIISISKAEHLTSFWYGGLGGTRKWPIHGTVEPPFRRDTRDQGKCPLNRGVPSTELTDTNIIQWMLQSGDNLKTRTMSPKYRCPFNRGNWYKIIWTCFGGSGGNNVWLEWWCPPNKRIPKERFYCKMTTQHKVLPENANLSLSSD